MGFTYGNFQKKNRRSLDFRWSSPMSILRVPTYACCANDEDANGHGDDDDDESDPKKCRNCSGTSANLPGFFSMKRESSWIDDVGAAMWSGKPDCPSLGLKSHRDGTSTSATFADKKKASNLAGGTSTHLWLGTFCRTHGSHLRCGSEMIFKDFLKGILGSFSWAPWHKRLLPQRSGRCTSLRLCEVGKAASCNWLEHLW